MVTTKKGRTGQMKVNASASMFVTTRPDLGKLNLMNASEKVVLNWGWQPGRTWSIVRIGAGLPESWISWDNGMPSGKVDLVLFLQKRRKNQALRTNGANWQDEVYQNAINQQYNLSFSGGSEKATYYFSPGIIMKKEQQAELLSTVIT